MKSTFYARIALILALVAGVASFQVHGAYLEDKTGESDSRDTVMEPPVPRPRPIPMPERDNPLRRLLRQVEVGRPFAHGRMTVFPLEIRDPDDEADIRTLDDALNHGWITVREHDKARVSAVVVRNESRHTVFMMAGEILGGGRQDRILQKDILLRPNMGEVTVPVYCGEQDRWKGERESFDRAPHIAGQAMRSMAARADSQEAIWTAIDQQLKKSEVKAPTRSYQSLYSDPKASRLIDSQVERFHRVRTRRTVGLVIVDLGRVIGADLFGSPALCAALWDKIIRSHVADYPREEDWRIEEERKMAVDGSAAAVRRFLNDMSEARQERDDTPGAGGSFTLRGGVDGRVLIGDDEVIHAVAFPDDDDVKPMPLLEPRR